MPKARAKTTRHSLERLSATTWRVVEVFVRAVKAACLQTWITKLLCSAAILLRENVPCSQAYRLR